MCRAGSRVVGGPVRVPGGRHPMKHSQEEDSGPKVALKERSALLLREHLGRVRTRTDRLLVGITLAQWALAIILALGWSPHGWSGKARGFDLAFFETAVFVGAVLTAIPVVLARWRPGSTLTRHAIAVSQALWSALLIHLSGGRIET